MIEIRINDGNDKTAEFHGVFSDVESAEKYILSTLSEFKDKEENKESQIEIKRIGSIDINISSEEDIKALLHGVYSDKIKVGNYFRINDRVYNCDWIIVEKLVTKKPMKFKEPYIRGVNSTTSFTGKVTEYNAVFPVYALIPYNNPLGYNIMSEFGNTAPSYSYSYMNTTVMPHHINIMKRVLGKYMVERPGSIDDFETGSNKLMHLMSKNEIMGPPKNQFTLFREYKNYNKKSYQDLFPESGLFNFWLRSRNYQGNSEAIDKYGQKCTMDTNPICALGVRPLIFISLAGEVEEE